MDENGYYDGWGDYKVNVCPDFINDFTLSIVGKNRNNIKDMIYDCFDYSLREILEY
jgi:hypothetical protein